MTYYILCIITYIISYPVPISCLLSCSGYTSMLYYSFLTYCFIIYIFLYDLVLSYTLHLRFHSDYRIGIHDIFETEPRPICHSIVM